MKSRLLKNLKQKQTFTTSCNYNMVGICSMFTTEFKITGIRY
jgi:hypothetical protein